jgi:acyl-CoA synthetase (AMP-forming)/AMP-acid ligase II
MLFNKFCETVNKFPNLPALNNWSYKDLLDIVIDSDYKFLSDSSKEFILIDILKAAAVDKPLVIFPKYKKEEVSIPEIDSKNFCLYLYSSGTSGPRKSIRVTESQIYYNCLNAIMSQKIVNTDRILTICSMNHTGGINAQSLAGLISGSHIIVQDFNPYNFSSLLKEKNISLTHLVPIMIDSLLKIKSFDTGNLRLVVAGSDCVKREHVDLFLKRSIPFMINYGLTEAGPIVINHIFNKKEELEIFEHGVPLGTNCWTEYKIENNELMLKGNIVSIDGWLNTGDCVKKYDEWFIYQGRKSHGCKIIPKNYK